MQICGTPKEIMDIKDKIYNLRKKSRLSQEDLSFKLGVSRQTVSKWEAGFVQPSFENLKSLCDVFQVSLSYFEEVADCADEAAADVDDGTSSVDDENADNIATVSDEKLQTPEKSEAKTRVIYIISAVILSVLSAIMLVLSVVVGLVAFSSNSGDVTVSNYKFDTWAFVFCIAAFVLFLAFAIVLSARASKCTKNTEC